MTPTPLTYSSSPRCVMIIAGEASGDQHGAKLVAAMQTRDPTVFFCGIGGRALRNAGVRTVMDADALSVVGVTEVFSKIGVLLKGMQRAKRLLRLVRPDLLIVIDFPDFNLHVAAYAKKCRVPVLYYISPQIWAWRRGRVRKIKSLVDHMAVILPFEAAFYEAHDIPVTYVGHPLLDDRCRPSSASGSTKPAAPSAVGAASTRHRSADSIGGQLGASPDSAVHAVEAGDEIVVGLLPGSRDKEIRRHLPLMLEAAGILGRRMAGVRFLVSLAPSADRSLVAAIVADKKGPLDVDIVDQPVSRVLARSRLVLAVSGTVTLEAAIAQTPTIIIYKVSLLSYWLAKTLVKVEHIGLINLIAGEAIMPELIQKKASAANIAAHMQRYIGSAAALENMSQRLGAAKKRLGKGNPSDRVARIAFELMDTKRH